MSEEQRREMAVSTMRRLKQHCLVEVFVKQRDRCLRGPLDDGYSACAGINNVEILGSLDRIEEGCGNTVDAGSATAVRTRAEPTQV